MEPADGVMRRFQELGRRGREPLLATVTGLWIGYRVGAIWPFDSSPPARRRGTRQRA